MSEEVSLLLMRHYSAPSTPTSFQRGSRSVAFILSMVPLVISSDSGAEMRQALGTAVFFDMLGVTFFSS